MVLGDGEGEFVEGGHVGEGGDEEGGEGRWGWVVFLLPEEDVEAEGGRVDEGGGAGVQGVELGHAGAPVDFEHGEGGEDGGDGVEEGEGGVCVCVGVGEGCR